MKAMLLSHSADGSFLQKFVLFLIMFVAPAYSQIGGQSDCICRCPSGYAQVGLLDSDGESNGIEYCPPNRCQESKCYCQKLASDDVSIMSGQPVFEVYCATSTPSPTPTPSPYSCSCDPPPSEFCNGANMSYRITRHCADSCDLLSPMQVCEYTCRLAPGNSAQEIWERSVVVEGEGSCGKEFMPCTRAPY
jgi:hypothetical protein